MKRIIIALVGIIGGVIWLAPGVASAHHPVVTGQATCQEDGTYRVNWTAVADADRDKEWRLELGPAWTEWQPDEQSFNWFTVSPGTSTVATVNIRAEWRPGGPTVGAKGTVKLGGDCTVPTTTVPETTVPPPTTTPETTTPPTTVPIEDVCHINGSTDTIPYGGFVFYNSSLDPRAVGTHSISGIPCGPPETTTTPPPTTAPPTTAPPTLPSTGANNWLLSAVATLAILIGGGLLMGARRP